MVFPMPACEAAIGMGRTHGEKGNSDMIHLTGLDGSVLYINYFQIMFIELIPETKVVLTNGRYYVLFSNTEEEQEKLWTLHGWQD